MWYTYVLTRSYVNMALSFAVVSNNVVTTRKFNTKWDCNSYGITSLKRKRKERWFVDLRIILILHCSNEFLKQVLNFHFKSDDGIPRYGSTINSSFLGKVGITFFGTWSLFKKDLMNYSIIPDW